MNASSELKRKVRERVWRLLEERGVARFPRPVHGRIPNFSGAEVAAKRILQLEEFTRARVVKVNPDSPQMMVRRGVLEAGKTLLMPSPRLRGKFLILDPKKIPRRLYDRAASISGAFQLGIEADLEDLPKVDLLVCGSVAVTERGERIGKGGGYSELEYAILRELGLVEEETPIATSVHELQLVDDAPLEMHDFTVDYIATPVRIIRTRGERRRPKGIMWEELSKEIAEIPLIRKLRERNLM